MYLCVVSLSSPDWSAHQRLEVLQKKKTRVKARVRVGHDERKRQRGEERRFGQRRGSQIKGRKAPFPWLNVPQGGVGGGRECTRKRERLRTDNAPARLQIYNYQAVRALSCLFLQPVKTNCRHVSINHILLRLAHPLRPRFLADELVLPSVPLVRGSLCRGKSLQ